MQNRRGGVGVAALDGYLYAVGGNDGTTSLLTAERYNPHTNKWTMVAKMNRRRAGFFSLFFLVIFSGDHFSINFLSCLFLYNVCLQQLDWPNFFDRLARLITTLFVYPYGNGSNQAFWVEYLSFLHCMGSLSYFNDAVIHRIFFIHTQIIS